MDLEIVHNHVFENFLLGHFPFKKTNRVITMMALNQLQEQNNWTITSSVASSYANRTHDSALIRWETCGEETSRIFDEFKDKFRPQIENSNSHHEDSSSFAHNLYKPIKLLYEALLVNPFSLKNKMICKIHNLSTDLSKDTYITMSAMILEGKKQYKLFICRRLL